jgi:uncharacterized membrane protein YqiK
MEWIGTLIAAVVVAVVVIAILVKLADWLYVKSSGEAAFVRTGLGGSKVVRNGGALVIPVIHQTAAVNMNTLRLEVKRADAQALKTKDSMRVNVQAAFYVHVQPEKDAILRAAATLGQKTMNPEALRDLVEGKFVDALRAVAAEMEMRELHEHRSEFVHRVGERVAEDLLKNGLELESVSLTEFDQAPKESFNPQNAFDAEGLTKLSRDIEERRRIRNEIERDTEVAIQRKSLDVERKQLEIQKHQLDIAREAEDARLAQQQEVAFRRAQQAAEVAREEAERKRAAEEARIAAQKVIDQAGIEAKREVEAQRVAADRAVAEARIESERALKAREIARAESLQVAEVQRGAAIEIAEQERAIAVAAKARDKAAALAESDAAQVRSRREVDAAEIETRREVEEARLAADLEVSKARLAAEQAAKERELAKMRAVDVAAVERAKAVELAEHDRAIAIAAKAKDRAEALAKADRARAEAVAVEQQVITARETARVEGVKQVRTLEAEAAKVAAKGEADAERLKLEATAHRFAVDAAGKRALHEADNQLSPDQVALKLRLASLERLPDIIRESARPMAEIDSIRIVQVEGLNGANGVPAGEAGAGGGNFAEQVMNSALRYRAQAPLVDSVLKEVGLDGATVEGLTSVLKFDRPAQKPAVPGPVVQPKH